MTDHAANAHVNRLAQETSPYLLQHQHNPVDWHPWGEDAFARAKREGKPIFLSVGYSTCYWCHVMERQSFESETVAAVMNEKFVNIKVDREERPDVDQLYMTAVQLLARQGGWPMSVWMTPDLKPFYGGTYYPPTDAYGRPGFVTLLHALHDAFQNRRAEVEQSAEQIAGVLRQVAEPESPRKPITMDQAYIDDLVARSVSDYDPVYGGFGSAPKFPRETVLEFLLVYLDSEGESSDLRNQVRRRLLHSLDALAMGGIRDHLGGGFHRYSTDAKWLVPHFEIMLYDNALLAWCYAEAYRQTREERYARVARGVLDFVLREMTSPQGAFYTALDAEVDGQEGLNYLWTREEIESVLSAGHASAFNEAYGVDRGPNFADPHHGSGTPDKNILFLPKPLTAEQDARFEPIRQQLKAERDRRKQPLLDTKILTSWNALMIRALAHAGTVLQRADYLQAARRGAQFLLDHHRTPDGGLLRTSRDGRAKYAGFLDDYAYLSHAMFELGGEWMPKAMELIRAMMDRFGDGDGRGLYFTDRAASDLPVRQKTATDSPLPSGNAIAALVLLKTGASDAARNICSAFASQLNHHGEGMSALAQAAMLILRKTSAPVTASPAPLAAPRPASPQDTAREVVRLDSVWLSRSELRLRLGIAKGFHINSNTPREGMSLVATRIVVDGMTAQDVEVVYPPGEIYEDEAAVALRFAKSVTGELRLSLTYQPCDDNACLAPITQRLAVPAP